MPCKNFENSPSIKPPWRNLARQTYSEQIANFLSQLPADRWPDRGELNEILTKQFELCYGSPLKPRLGEPPLLGKRRRQTLKRQGLQQYLDTARSARYESMIMEKGLIPHRLMNVHDLMNAAIWYMYPRSKLELHRQAYLIQQQMDATGSSQANGRNSDLDQLTCFDEGGLILLCDAKDVPEARDLICERDLAIKARHLSQLPCELLIFGHGIWEELCRGLPQVLAMTLVIGIDTFPLGAANDPMRLVPVDLALETELRQNFHWKQTPRALTSAVIGSLPLPSFPEFRMEKTGQSRQASSLMKP